MRWRCAGALGAAVLWCAAVDARAAEWSGDATVFVRQEYNDNILMTPAAHEAVLGTTASGALALRRAMEQFQLNLTGLTELTHYVSHQHLDTTNYNAALDSTYTAGRATWGLDASATQDLTLGGELQETGIVLTRTRRQMWSAAPSWSWALTERTTLQWQYQFTRVHYPGVPGVTDYLTHVGIADVIDAVTERTTLTAKAQFTDYDAAALRYQSQDGSLQVGVTHHLSERTTASLFGGADLTLSRAVAVQDLQSGWVLNASLEHRSERFRLSGSASHDIHPSGAGYLVQVDHLAVQASRELLWNVTALASGDLYRTTALRNDIAIPDNHYQTVSAGLSWAWREHWTVEANYRYAKQSQPTDVASNAVDWKVAYHRDTLFGSP